MSKRIDLTGQRFGRLTVVEKAERATDGRALWRCTCECGGEKITRAQRLSSGATRSCGCLGREKSAERAPDLSRANRTHGMTDTPEYESWSAMVQRCTNQRNPDYSGYGGRGITVCGRWRTSFEAFYADMGPRPAETSLDRIDVNGNYEPGNCRWATRKEQQRNTRRNRLVMAFGEELPLAEWAERIGIDYGALQGRLDRGWSTERALTTGVDPEVLAALAKDSPHPWADRPNVWCPGIGYDDDQAAADSSTTTTAR